MVYRLLFLTLFLMLFPILFMGCSKSTVVLLDSGKKQNAILIANENGTTKLDKVGSYVDISKEKKQISEVKSMSADEINSRFSQALAVAPEKAMTYIVYFKPNSTDLTEASKTILKKALASIKERSPANVDIIGHTDTVGSNEGNIKVSLKRARVIKNIIEEEKIKTLSLVAKGYGEEDLLVKTKDNVDEAKNRNVEIFIK